MTYSYTLDNRLASISQGTSTTTYQYDPYGRRISKTVDGETTWFVWDNESRLLAEYSEDSSTSTAELTQLYSYVPGEYAPSQVTDSNGNYQVVSDHLSTPKLLVDVTTEEVVWQATKAAFGETTVDEDVDADGIDVVFNFRFPGQYEDTESGLYYNYYRDYDPTIGRYVQSDPIGLGGGLNTYGYALQNPLMYADPTGENPLIIPAIPAIGEFLIWLGVGGWIACDAIDCTEPLPNLDDTQSYPMSIPSNNEAYDECENACELEWDRNKFMCDSVGAMQGFKSAAYVQCLRRIDTILVECIQECAEEENCPQ